MLLFISAGAGLLPFCMNEDKNVIPLKNISIGGSQEKMLTAGTERILP